MSWSCSPPQIIANIDTFYQISLEIMLEMLENLANVNQYIFVLNCRIDVFPNKKPTT